MQRFTDLKVWQRSHALALDVYRLTTASPADERFGLISQLRRAIVSVPTNIAEGSKRRHNHDYARFLNISEASLAGAEYLLMLSRDLEYLSVQAVDRMLHEVTEVASSSLRSKVETHATDERL